MRTFHHSYPVRLREQQRRWLEAMVHTSSTPTRHYLVARVLLMSDQSQGQPSHIDGQIAKALADRLEIHYTRHPRELAE
jgi:hypothetical protein